jgi:hypothetical protein
MKGLTLVYTYRNGTVPPPHHYEFTIRLEPGKPGAYEFRPGYPGMGAGIQVWKESFVFNERQHEMLYKKLVELGLTRRWQENKQPPVGGGSSTLKVTVDGKTWSVPSFATDSDAAQKIFETVEGVVPPALVKKQKKRFEAAKKQKQPGVQ